MPITQAELTQFQQFATAKLAGEGADSIEQLVGLWRLENRSADQVAEDTAAIKRGIADADAGRVTPVTQAFDEVRAALRNKR